MNKSVLGRTFAKKFWSMVEALVDNPILLIVLVFGIGFGLGKISIFGVKLGPAAVLFTGLFFKLFRFGDWVLRAKLLSESLRFGDFRLIGDLNDGCFAKALNFSKLFAGELGALGEAVASPRPGMTFVVLQTLHC